jgi:hypothetical protein
VLLRRRHDGRGDDVHWELSNSGRLSDVGVQGTSTPARRESLMAQYAVLIYARDSAHAPGATAEDLDVCDDHSDGLAASGAMLAAYALTPRDMATSVRGDIITDGPFVDSKEVVAGFYVIEAPDLDAALAVARTNPVVREGGGVEVRPVHSSYLRPPGPDQAAPDRTAP